MVGKSFAGSIVLLIADMVGEYHCQPLDSRGVGLYNDCLKGPSDTRGTPISTGRS